MTDLLTHGHAASVCAAIPLSRPAQALVPHASTPADLLKLLTDNGLFADALPVLAHSLPENEAVWWACLCVRHVVGANSMPPARKALYAAARWAMQPTPGQRTLAARAAEVAGTKTFAGRVAFAVALTTGAHSVQTARLVTATALLVAAEGPSQDLNWNYHQYLTVGFDIHAGAAHWKRSRRRS